MNYCKSLAILTLCLFSTSMLATTLKYKSLDDLVVEATNIVKGEVTNISTIKVNKENFTDVTLSNVFFITDIALEMSPQDITLRLYGGVVDGVGMGYSGTPLFSVGQKIIAFTKKNGIYSIPIVGWEQGIIHIDNNNRVTDYYDNAITKINGKHLEKDVKNTPITRIYNDKTKKFTTQIRTSKVNTKQQSTIPAAIGIKQTAFIKNIQLRLKKRPAIINAMQTNATGKTAIIKSITNAQVTADRNNLFILPPVIPQNEKSDPKHANKF